jgi:hypothetical protein
MWVNLVSSAVMQPMVLPTRKEAPKMPKKSATAFIMVGIVDMKIRL